MTDSKAGTLPLQVAGKKITVGVAGTHSTGKSTFCDALDAKLRSIGLRVGRVAETAREARTLGFPILTQQTFDATLWIIARGICKELEAGIGNDIVVADRPVIDALCYLNAALRMRSEKLEEPRNEYLDDLVCWHLKTYGVLVKTIVDVSLPISSSRPRDLDYRFRALVDEELGAIFARLKCEAILLTRENFDSAVNMAVERCIAATNTIT